MPDQPTLREYLKKPGSVPSSEVRNILKDIASSVGSLDSRDEKVALILARVDRSLQELLKIKPPEVHSVFIKNPTREMSITNGVIPVVVKGPVQLNDEEAERKSHADQIKGLKNILRAVQDLTRSVDGLRYHLATQPKETIKEESSPTPASGISMMKRDRSRRQRWAIAPVEAFNAALSTYTIPTAFINGTLRAFVGPGRLYKENGDWTNVGQKITFTYPPSQLPLFDYEEV